MPSGWLGKLMKPSSGGDNRESCHHDDAKGEDKDEAEAENEIEIDALAKRVFNFLKSRKGIQLSDAVTSMSLPMGAKRIYLLCEARMVTIRDDALPKRK